MKATPLPTWPRVTHRGRCALDAAGPARLLAGLGGRRLRSLDDVGDRLLHRGDLQS